MYITCSVKQSVMSKRSTLELFIGLPMENFSIVLKEVELKDRFSYEINYKGNVGDTDHSFRILLLPTCRRNVEEQVSQMMFL